MWGLCLVNPRHAWIFQKYIPQKQIINLPTQKTMNRLCACSLLLNYCLKDPKLMCYKFFSPFKSWFTVLLDNFYFSREEISNSELTKWIYLRILISRFPIVLLIFIFNYFCCFMHYYYCIYDNDIIVHLHFCYLSNWVNWLLFKYHIWC